MRSATYSEGQDEVSSIRKRFRTLLELGRGGMARVFLAESLTTGVRKLVVLKVLNRELSLDADMRAGFRREAEISARMNHPNVVQVFEVVEQVGQPVIVMEYLDGLSLSRLLQQAPLPLPLHVEIVTQVLAGLHHFHELKDFDESALNAVHRDVSPQNVLVLHDGLAKVVDFGIAKVNASGDDQTRTGLVKGKIHYMSPEQLIGDGAIDRRADVFSVGVMLWEAIAGRRMWQGLTSQQVIRALARGELPSIREAAPGVSAELESIVQRAIDPDRNGRFATAEEMQNALSQAMAAASGVVHRRELASFMHLHFGDARSAQRKRIDEARRNPTVDSGISERMAPSERPSEPPSGELLGGSAAATRLDRGSSRSQRAVLVLACALAAVLVVAVVLLMRKPASQAAEPAREVAPPVPRKVHFQILVEPLEAEILLGGERLGAGRYAAKRAISMDERLLQIRAPGHRNHEELIRFDDDVLRLIRLDPIPAESSGAAAMAELGPTPKPVPQASPKALRSAPAVLGDEVAEISVTEPEAGLPISDEEGATVAPLAVSEEALVTPRDVPKVLTGLTGRAGEAKAVAPKQVPSKIGHGRLAVDVGADPYRIRLPRALAHMERTFDTTVGVCVTKNGAVSTVKILSSTDPALGRHLSTTIGRWRYQPLLDGGRAIPFCYQLRFQLSGR